MATETELVFHCIHCNTEIDDPETMEGMCADCFWDTEDLYRGKPLQFTVYENGTLFPVSQMTTHEAYAIQCEVEQIVGDLDAFDVELDCGEEVDYGVVKCSEPARLMAFQGKIYRVQPKQYGLSPWKQDVQIRFETILTERNDDDGCGHDGCGCGPRDYCLDCEKEAVKGHDMCRACEVKYNTQCYACVSKDGMLRHICE